MEKVLVTGGAGFIGSHLCERLLSLNYDVYSIDNYFTGKKSNHINGVTYIEGSTSNINKLINFKPSIVYHLGEYSRVEQSFEDIDKLWSYNKDGIFAVLQFCRENNSKIVYAGSSTKFGDGGLGRSQSPYAWCKATNSELVKNYGTWFNLNYAIVYFYNVYGPREIAKGKYATLIGLFKEKVKNNEELTVVSPGTQKRNFTHVQDIIEGLILVGEKGNGDNYGIGSPDTYSVLEIANFLNSPILMIPERPGNRMDAEIDTSKTEALGWKPKWSIKDYLISK
jgi:UDP-glucose 4-epimerase